MDPSPTSISVRKSFGGLLRRVTDAAKVGLDPDRGLMAAMAGYIELARARRGVDPGAVWQRGEPLSLLMAGYTGTRNTGADVRVEEMIRQFRWLFGDDHLSLSILTIDPELSRGYFKTVRQVKLPDFYPPFLYDTVHEHHGVIACEGSMFKSKFANALSTMMVGALGLAAAEGKLAIGYGGEAGKMDEPLEKLVRRYCGDALIIARNEESKTVLDRLGVASRAGTDTAWTFEPAPAAVGEARLRRAGWDGATPVLALCPINAFWWPVKPDLVRGALTALGAESDAHYKSVYFHADSKEIRDAQRRYVEAIAEAARAFADRHAVFPILVGMEQLDRRACETCAEMIGPNVPVFVSDELDMYEMVSVLRHASMMVSSRYHAIVTSMPGLVASAGITMDERIKNLMADRGTPELALRVDDPSLADATLDVLERLHTDAEALRDGIGACVVSNLERMGAMGQALVDHVRERHPELPLREGLGSGGDPWDHLPPLPDDVQTLVARYRNGSGAQS